MNIESIGKLVMERRKMLSVGQKEVASLSGISTHALSDLEGGKGNPTLTTLLKVCEVLGLKVCVGV